MKPIHVLGAGVFLPAVLISTWVGCSSNNSSSGDDGGSDATSSSSSSSSGSSSGSSSSSSSSGSGSGSGSSSSSSGSSSGTTADAGDAGHDAGNTSDASSDAVADAAPLTYTQVYADMISQGKCTVCHTPSTGLNDAGMDAGPGGGFKFGKLDLTDIDASYAALIGVPPMGIGIPGSDAGICDLLSPEAGSDSGVFRVVPNNAAHSLICNKIHGFDLIEAGMAPFCGGPMPLSGAIPNGGQEALFNEVKTWINEGANR